MTVRVLHVAKVAGISGSENHLLLLLPALRERGFDVRFVMLHEGEPGAAELAVRLEESGVAVDRLRLPWAIRVPWLDANPERVIELLELLKDDPASLVRRTHRGRGGQRGGHKRRKRAAEEHERGSRGSHREQAREDDEVPGTNRVEARLCEPRPRSDGHGRPAFCSCFVSAAGWTLRSANADQQMDARRREQREHEAGHGSSRRGMRSPR